MPNIYLVFPGGKYKVLTMSYDDGKESDRKLVSIFNQYGIKGTFHLNSGLLGEGDRIGREEAKDLYKGHEISAHTVMHPTIARCPKELIVREIMEDRERLENIAGYTVRGVSYPNGSYSPEIKNMLPHLGIEYARIVKSTGQFEMPDDLFEWKPTCHHKEGLMDLAEQFVGFDKKQYLYLMYVWGHSYEFDLDDNWELIEGFCRLAGGMNDIWYATNMEIVDYINAFRQLKFAVSNGFVWNPGAISVWLSVDGEIVEVTGGSQINL